jgi:hypothetical protein
MRIEEYFQQIEATLALFPHVALKTMRYDQRSETKGFISGIIHFADRSELHVREFVDVSAGIERFKYSYHYMHEGHMIFRYDNAADITARDFATYPHHKHVGEVIQASHAPTLREVLEEIVASLP